MEERWWIGYVSIFGGSQTIEGTPSWLLVVLWSRKGSSRERGREELLQHLAKEAVISLWEVQWGHCEEGGIWTGSRKKHLKKFITSFNSYNNSPRHRFLSSFYMWEIWGKKRRKDCLRSLSIVAETRLKFKPPDSKIVALPTAPLYFAYLSLPENIFSGHLILSLYSAPSFHWISFQTLHFKDHILALARDLQVPKPLLPQVVCSCSRADLGMAGCLYWFFFRFYF